VASFIWLGFGVRVRIRVVGLGLGLASQASRVYTMWCATVYTWLGLASCVYSISLLIMDHCSVCIIAFLHIIHVVHVHFSILF